jgi:GntR family transcriptional repressor for pyruvate dehydrogenase complex
MFKQAKQNRAFEDVISQIQESILQGRLKEGDKLPAERKLREIFKISRGTLREALRALEQKKLITIKTGVGGGAFVCDIDTRQMSESLDLLLQYQKVSLRELAEFRENVEGLVAAKAAQKAKKEDLEQLKILLYSIEKILNSGELRWDEYIAADNKFHLILARVAGNRIFESVLYTIYENINRYFERFLPKKREIIERNYQDLSKIAGALEKRNSNKARDLVQRHVKYFNRLMEDGEKFRGVSFNIGKRLPHR